MSSSAICQKTFSKCLNSRQTINGNVKEAFARINQVYAQYFSVTLPARAAVQVAALPKNADIEIEAIISL